jgi:TATA-box binding protein (TBP) (component of TFIID and TFIIIB)
MKWITPPIAALTFALGPVVLTGCEEESEVEEAVEETGEAIEDGAEDLKDSVEDGAEELGDEIDDATD